MAVTKTINIDGVSVALKASAALPRMYRMKFNRDLFKDIFKLTEEVDGNDERNSNINYETLSVFEDLAWLMAYHADPEKTAKTPDEWLEQFNTFSIFTVLPEILDLWGLNTETKVKARKKVGAPKES